MSKKWFFNVVCIMMLSMVMINSQAWKPLKILFVVNFFPRRTETFILNQIIRLIDRGHDIWIHAYQHGNNHELDAGVKKYNLLKRVSYGPVCTADIHSFDILYCQFGMMGNKMLHQKRKQQCTTKLVCCFRGYDITRQLYKYPHTYDKLLQEGDLFLPVCEFFAHILIDLGAAPQKIIVHPSAIDCSLFAYSYQPHTNDGIIHITSVSRLIEKKGIEHALHAVAQVINKYPNVHYTIVGDGYLKSRLQILARTLGISKNVTFTGAISHKDVMQVLKNTHIFLLPSIKTKNGEAEGIPNALKEAMACGIPVISTVHAGIPELIKHGISGLLSQEGDVFDLVRNICFCIQYPQRCIDMGIAGRSTVLQSFDLDTRIIDLENMFYALLYS